MAPMGRVESLEFCTAANLWTRMWTENAQDLFAFIYCYGVRLMPRNGFFDAFLVLWLRA